MKFNLYNLTKEQISVIKGFAIIIIVLHNLLHLLVKVKENEMSYDLVNFLNLFTVTFENPATIFNNILSYFGHYGVQLFIFVSAYGLTKKYLNQDKINFKKYIIPRLVKIYSLLIVGLIVYFIFYFGNVTIKDSLKIIVSSLSMLNNLSYDRIFQYVGPWWFFSLIIQLYFLFPFLLRIIKKYNDKGFYLLLIACYLLIYLLFPITEKYRIPLFGNFPGHLPEFILGIGFAYFKKFNLNYKHFIGFLFIFVIASLSKYTFPLSFLSITILLLIIIYPLYSNTTNRTAFFFNFVGKMSMIVFVLNAIFRNRVCMPFFTSNNFSPIVLSLMSIVYLALVLLISYLVYYLYQKIVDPGNNKLINKLLK